MKIKTFFFFLFFLPLVAFAQEEDTLLEEEADTSAYFYEEAEEDYLASERSPYHAPPLEPLAARKIEQNQWDEAAGGLDYSKDLPKPPKEEKPRDINFNPSFDWTSATQGLGSFFQALAVLAAIAAIAYGIWRMLEAPRNRLIARDGVEITLDNLDHYLHETDLDRFLREALAQGNYALAVRLYYLQIIKSLSEKNVLKWSREKTNRDYLREMRGHPLAEQFREATRIYERVWYGNQPLSAEKYASLEPKMKGVLAGV